MLTKILAQIVYYLIRLLNLTYRYQFIGLENKLHAKQVTNQKAYIYATWHQNLIGDIFSHIGERFTMIISESKDGELVATTCKKLGHFPVRGSSTRGGKKALIEIVKNIKKGFPGAITVDGPKGPAHIVKPGITEIARLCNCAILPLSSYPVSFWTFKKSWDQFRFPKPFSKIIVVIGKPVLVPKDANRDQLNQIALLIAKAIDEGEEAAKLVLYN